MSGYAYRPLAALKWAAAVFGPVALDRRERGLRLVEESVELGQALDVSAADVARILARVYSRPAGNVAKEIGQVGMTLELLAESVNVNADEATQAEFERVTTIPQSEWERRHAAKVALGIAT
jgi:NTP pyrophosphatase (non-canonical NTP hydrolase)